MGALRLAWAVGIAVLYVRGRCPARILALTALPSNRLRGVAAYAQMLCFFERRNPTMKVNSFGQPVYMIQFSSVRDHLAPVGLQSRRCLISRCLFANLVLP